MRKALGAAMLSLALAVPGIALAHVSVSPPFVEDGIESDLAFAVPNERPPHTTVTVEATAPPGVSVVSAGTPTGWKAAVSGSKVTWIGGRIAGREAVSFPLRIVARVPAGTYAFSWVQTYDDAATVRFRVDLEVLPASGAQAPGQYPWGVLAAAVAGVVVIVASIAALRHLRRRSLQDR